MQVLTNYLSEDNCPVTNLFIDWNPIYQEGFQAGDSVPVGTNQRYQMAAASSEEDPGEVSQWAKLVSDAKKLQVLFLRCSGLGDRDL